MIFGRTTFETLPGVLPGRLSVVMSRNVGEWEEKEENLIFTSLCPQSILKKLDTLGFENPIVAGGATINSIFAQERLIDEIIITISPLVFGSGMGLFVPGIDMELALEKFKKIGANTLALWYSVKK